MTERTDKKNVPGDVDITRVDLLSPIREIKSQSTIVRVKVDDRINGER